MDRQLIKIARNDAASLLRSPETDSVVNLLQCEAHPEFG